MDRAKIQALLELIGEIVNDNNKWREKRDKIKDQANETGHIINLEEFTSWFD